MSVAPSAPTPFNYTAAAALGGGVIGAVLGGIGASRQNKALKQSAQISLSRLNDYITQIRVDRLLQTDRLARSAQVALGDTLNVAPEGQAAIQTIASRIVAGAAGDQFAIDENARRQETMALAEKQNVVTGANNQMQSPAAAALGGAVGGAAQGMALGQGIDQLSQGAGQAAAMTTMFDQEIAKGEASRQILRSQLDEAAAKTLHAQGMLFEMQRRIGPLASSPYVIGGASRIFSPIWQGASY